MTPEPPPLEMFVVYRNPLDYPGLYVVRRWTVRSQFTGPLICTSVEAGELIATAHTLNGAREAIPATLSNIGRFGDDDPAIREVWL